MHPALVLTQRFRSDALVEFISLRNTAGEELVKMVSESLACGIGRQTQLHGAVAAGRNIQEVVSCGLGTRLLWVYCCPVAPDHDAMESVFHIGGRVGLSPKPLTVAVIFRKEKFRITVKQQLVLAQ